MSDPLTLSSNYAEIKTDYSYQSFEKDGKPMASSKTETLYNTVSSVTDGIKTDVSTEGYYYEYDDNGNITHEYLVSADGTKTLRYRYTYDKAEQLVRLMIMLTENHTNIDMMQVETEHQFMSIHLLLVLRSLN